MNYVYLDSKYNEYFVDDETYATIVSLVQQHKQCLHDYRNRHPFTQDNPCVGKNICLEHLLQKQPQLSRLDVQGLTSDNKAIYYFVDKRGMVYTATEDSSTEASESLTDTLSYYGFTPPKTVTSRGKSVDFYAYYARVYGDLTTASVIVLSYNHYSEKVKGLFLLYKNGPTKELHKRSDVYARALELVEANKDNGHASSYRSETDTYEVISQLESALYDVTRKLQNGKGSTDIQTGGQDVEESMRQNSEA